MPNIYEFLLEAGATPEAIQRLMAQIQASPSQGLMTTTRPGMSGAAASRTPAGLRPSGMFRPPSPLRR